MGLMRKRLLILNSVGALPLACQPPEGGEDATGQGGNIIATPDSSSGAPGAEPVAPLAPAPIEAVGKTLPPAFHGAYDESGEACGRPSEYRLVVTQSELRFHESIGTVRSVSVQDRRTVTVNADYQGEGQSWRNARRLELSEDGGTLTVAGEGTSLARVRCP
jgi:hypothetical protein